jgi:protein ImuB
MDATATSKVFTRVVKLPVPTTVTKLLLKLLQLDLNAHPPGAPVLKVSLEAEPLRAQAREDASNRRKAPAAITANAIALQIRKEILLAIRSFAEFGFPRVARCELRIDRLPIVRDI